MFYTSQSFTERVQHLGSDEGIVAIRTDPVAGRTDTAVLLLNAGVLHRIGPHRMHVTLARSMARLGITGLRVDLSGIGESRPVPGSLGFRESAVADIRAAMDQLGKECELRHFILFGLCSGADNGLAAAAADPRVVAAILVDPPAYSTPASRRRHWLGRFSRWHGFSSLPGTLLALARATGSRLLARLPGSRHGAMNGESARRPPPLEDFARQVTALVDRGTRLLFVYSGALGARYNSCEQFFEWMPSLKGKVDVAFFPAANHVFTDNQQRQHLVAKVLEWTERFLRDRESVAPISANDPPQPVPQFTYGIRSEQDERAAVQQAAG